MVTTKDILKFTGLKTPRTLTAWYKAGLIPRPRIMRHPSGKGTVAVWPDEAMDRCIALAKLRKPGRPSREAKLNLRIFELLDQKPIREGLQTPEDVIRANTANDGNMINREDDLPEFFIAMLAPAIFTYFSDKHSRSAMISKIRSQEVMRQALDLYRSGFHPVLVADKYDMQVTQDFMVSRRLTDEAFADHAMVVVSLLSLLKKAFLLARVPFPEVKPVSTSTTSEGPTDSVMTETDIFSPRGKNPGQVDLPHAGSDGKDSAEGK